MLKLIVVLVTVCVIGTDAQCQTQKIFRCMKNDVFVPNESKADICKTLNNDKKCQIAAGCDEKSMQTLYNTFCGTKSSCDIKQFNQCFMVYQPVNKVYSSLMKKIGNGYKSCLINSGCSDTANKIGNKICVT